jgi:hypothetical protein
LCTLCYLSRTSESQIPQCVPGFNSTMRLYHKHPGPPHFTSKTSLGDRPCFLPGLIGLFSPSDCGSDVLPNIPAFRRLTEGISLRCLANRFLQPVGFLLCLFAFDTRLSVPLSGKSLVFQEVPSFSRVLSFPFFKVSVPKLM